MSWIAAPLHSPMLVRWGFAETRRSGEPVLPRIFDGIGIEAEPARCHQHLTIGRNAAPYPDMFCSTFQVEIPTLAHLRDVSVARIIQPARSQLRHDTPAS